jgi:hypothetical protein
MSTNSLIILVEWTPTHHDIIESIQTLIKTQSKQT